MNNQQKRAATGTSLVIIAFVSLFLGWLALVMMSGTTPLGDHFPGRFFMLLIHNETGLGTALKSLPFLITFGMSLLATRGLRDWIFYGIIAVSLIGIAAAIFILNEASAVSTARRFWQFSPVPALESYQSFVAAINKSLIPFIAWFVGILACQLGIVLPPKNGDGA